MMCILEVSIAIEGNMRLFEMKIQQYRELAKKNLCVIDFFRGAEN